MRVSSILDFTFLDTVLFVKFVETSLHHTSRKRIHFVSLKSKNYLAPSSGFWTLVRVSSILDSTCLEAVLHVNYAQTLFQHLSRKPKNFVSSTSKHYLAPISVFWTLVSVFLNTWFHLTWRTSVYKSCEDFVSPHIKKARTLCFIGIQHLFSSEQWFLDLVSVFVSTSFHLSPRSSVCKSCLQFVTPLFNKAKTLCFIEIQ